MNITVDFSKKCGPVKDMHSVNNGPAGSKVRGGNSTYKYFEEAQIPYARIHDASFSTAYGVSIRLTYIEYSEILMRM